MFNILIVILIVGIAICGLGFSAGWLISAVLMRLLTALGRPPISADEIFQRAQAREIRYRRQDELFRGGPTS